METPEASLLVTHRGQFDQAADGKSDVSSRLSCLYSRFSVFPSVGLSAFLCFSGLLIFSFDQNETDIDTLVLLSLTAVSYLPSS